MECYDGSDLLSFLWTIYRGRYTKRITGTEEFFKCNFQFPLNPLSLVISVINAVLHLPTACSAPLAFFPEFTKRLEDGFFIPTDIWNAFAVVISDHPPLMQCDTAQFNQVEVHPDHTIALAHPSNAAYPAIAIGPTSLAETLTHEQIACTEMGVTVVSEDHNTVHQHLNSHFQRMILKEKVAIDTTQLRRSTCLTRYVGFRVPQPMDIKPVVSKVKARVVPAITISSKATDPIGAAEKSDSKVAHVPPPTPIPTIQAISTNMCGVPPEDLSPRKLLASLQDEDSEAL